MTLGGMRALGVRSIGACCQPSAAGRGDLDVDGLADDLRCRISACACVARNAAGGTFARGRTGARCTRPGCRRKSRNAPSAASGNDGGKR